MNTRIGNSNDIITYPNASVVLMGGAGENDKAMKWFLQQCDGGDVVVLRTDNSNAYNDYLYNQLGVQINSVTTIYCLSYMASFDNGVLDAVANAEGIWFAGGDQAEYMYDWNNTPLDSLLNDAIENRHVVCGGISAGMAIQGEVIFTAANGTIQSNTALNNPFNQNVTLLNNDFLHNHWLHNLITDTHFNNPDRKGRLVTFLARMQTDVDTDPRSFAIACNEFTAVCIDTNGMATVFGDYPNYDDHVYFLQTICEPMDGSPETCLPNTPLTWNKQGEAVKVYNMKADSSGTHHFDLSNWNTANGGSWENWFVLNGVLHQDTGALAPNCNASTFVNTIDKSLFQIFPNPTNGNGQLKFFENDLPLQLEIFNALGELKINLEINSTTEFIQMPTEPGLYLVIAYSNGKQFTQRIIVQ